MRKISGKLRLKAKEIARRLTGISTPIGGVSWSPPPDERDKARRLLIYLSDRRALYQPYHMEIGPYVIESVLDIRKRLTAELEDLRDDSVLRDSIRAMQAACRRFLDQTQGENDTKWYRFEPIILSSLGELRGVFGIHIGRIACAYDLELENQLAAIIPSEPDD
jgi:hypothetical protein